jgi:predicted AAA+ superfamily ATPase
MASQKFKFRLLGKFLPASDKKKLVVLTGARQTGKTTLARLKYQELRYIILLNSNGFRLCVKASY